MFGNKNVQPYDLALDLVNGGRSELLVHERYHGDPRPSTWSDEDWSHWSEQRVALTDVWSLRREIYRLFAPVAERDIKSFVCGPFGEWNGTTNAYMDGSGFVYNRQPFIDALQHFRDEDGTRYLFAFLTHWFYRLEVVPVGVPTFGQDSHE